MSLPSRITVTATSLLLVGGVTGGIANAAPAAIKPAATIALDGVPSSGVLTPDGSKIFVAESLLTPDGKSLEGQVNVISTETNTVIAKIPVGLQPMFASMNAAGTRLYVPNYGAGTVSIVDVAANKVLATVRTGGSPTYAVVNPAGTKVYVPGIATDVMSVIDTGTNTVSASIVTEPEPQAVTFSKDGSRAYLTARDNNAIQVIDTATEKIIATTLVGEGPIRPVLDPKGAKVFIPNYDSDNVSVIDTNSNKVVNTIGVGHGPMPPVINVAGTRMWVGSVTDGTVWEINLTAAAKKNPVVRKIKVGKEPFFTLLNASEDSLYVANRKSNSISGICIKTGKVTKTFETGASPRMLVGGPALYSVNQFGKSVSVFTASLLGKGACS